MWYSILNAALRLHETIDFLKMCPDLRDMDIIYANELDDGAERSGNQNVAMEIAKAIGMNYAYGLNLLNWSIRMTKRISWQCSVFPLADSLGKGRAPAGTVQLVL